MRLNTRKHLDVQNGFEEEEICLVELNSHDNNASNLKSKALCETYRKKPQLKRAKRDTLISYFFVIITYLDNKVTR